MDNNQMIYFKPFLISVLIQIKIYTNDTNIKTCQFMKISAPNGTLKIIFFRELEYLNSVKIEEVLILNPRLGFLDSWTCCLESTVVIYNKQNCFASFQSSLTRFYQEDCSIIELQCRLSGFWLVAKCQAKYRLSELQLDLYAFYPQKIHLLFLK